MSIFQTIKYRIIALAILLVVLALVLRVSAALPFAQDKLRELVASQQLSSASYVARDIAHSIDAQRNFISELANVLPPSLLQQPQDLARWLQERQKVNPLFNNGLIVLQPDSGMVLAQYPVLSERQMDYTSFDWFKDALRTDMSVMSKPQLGPGGDPILLMAKAVRDTDKRVVAILAGVARLNAPGFLDGLPGGTSGFLLISPDDKLFVGASDASFVFKPTPPAGLNLLHDRAMTGYRGTGITHNARGVEELSAMVSVPNTGWFLVARMPTSEAFQPIMAMRSFVIIGSVVSALVLIALLMWSLPHILRPLTDASHLMREMADGRRELAPLPIKRKDEVGDLVLGFNYLVARLRDKETALKASEAHMEFMAHHDSLTGLYNRAMLEDRLLQAMARAERDSSHFALLFCDLDGFKFINDEFGHDTGDAILRHVASRLQDERRRTDTVARLGGDEFVVLLTDLDNAHDVAISVGKQLLADVGAPIEIGSKVFSVGVSIGIALYRGAGVSASQLMSQADTAMYEVKRTGKNSVRVFDDAIELPESAQLAGN